MRLAQRRNARTNEDGYKHRDGAQEQADLIDSDSVPEDDEMDPAGLQTEKQRAAVFNGTLDFSQERDSLPPINQPMVVREGDEHHGSYHNLRK